MLNFRKHLSLPALLDTIRETFNLIPDHRPEKKKNKISITDALMSGLAVFGLKYSSLLRFDEDKNEAIIAHNLRTLYGIQQPPSDTYMREILDPISPDKLHPVFENIFKQAQRGKSLESYVYLEDSYLVAMDGTGQFSSHTISCPDCCQKHHRNGTTTYYHQLLAAVLIHPNKSEVIPFAPEPITHQDGNNKNDCERNAAKRLLNRIRQTHPHLKLIITEDGLSSNAPHINLLKSLNMRFILGAKPGDHEYLFNQVETKAQNNEVKEWQFEDKQGVIHRFHFINDIALNASNSNLKVNFLQYFEVKGNKIQQFSWVTDFTLTKDNILSIMKGGRARWKIENETFNTLKNQGYHFEHNYGHGNKHLSSIFSLLMMLAFLVDQVQQLCCTVFKEALKKRRTKVSFWERIRSLFISHYISNWKDLFDAIILGHTPHKLKPNTS